MHRCYCPEQCLTSGGNDSEGRPLGVAFRKKHMLQSHQLRVQRERQAREAEVAHAEHQAQAHELQAAGAQIFATTLLDDPPLHNETTRSTAPRSNLAPSDDRSVQVIVDGIRQIALSPEPSITGVEDRFHRLSLDTPLASTQHPQLSSNIRNPTAGQPPDQRSGTGEQNQHTTIALTQLSNIQSGIQSSANALVGLPSAEKIVEITHLIKTWRQALASINRKVPLVTARKSETMKMLHKLEARIAEVHIISPSDPVQYNTGKS